MGKIITTSLAKRKASNYFNGMKAISIVKQSNIGGEEIEKGTTVKIIGMGITKGLFNIKDENTGIEIHNIWCEQLELLENDSN